MIKNTYFIQENGVGKRIIELREMRDMTTNFLANLSGVSQSFLREVELGNKQPTTLTLAAICDALEIDLKEFFNYEEEKDEFQKIISTLTQKQRNINAVY